MKKAALMMSVVAVLAVGALVGCEDKKPATPAPTPKTTTPAPTPAPTTPAPKPTGT